MVQKYGNKPNPPWLLVFKTHATRNRCVVVDECSFEIKQNALNALKEYAQHDGNGNLLYVRKNFFHKICCHSATNLSKPLCFKHIAVVAARWEVAAKPARQPNQPSQPHPQPLPEREGSGCAQ